MKVSDITSELVATYLILDYANMSTTEKAQLQLLIDTAKTYIRNNTGIRERKIIGETIGIGDGNKTEFKTALPIIPDTIYNIYINNVLLTKDIDYIIDITTGNVLMTEAPESGAIITADYETGIDAYQDFVIAVYVLCQDMYDNRSMYIDKNNANMVIDSILNMHAINLL